MYNYTFNVLGLDVVSLLSRNITEITIGLIVVFFTLIVIIVSVLLLLSESKGAKKGKKDAKAKKVREFSDITEMQSVLIDKMMKVGDSKGCVLFASNDVESMPVTIPVSAAVAVADKKLKCLIIDMDTKRDAVAKVFEPAGGSEKSRSRIMPTGITGVNIWPGRNFKDLGTGAIIPLIEQAANKYDYILINAPDFEKHENREKIACGAQSCFIFAKKGSQAGRIARILKGSGCRLIGSFQFSGESK